MKEDAKEFSVMGALKNLLVKFNGLVVQRNTMLGRSKDNICCFLSIDCNFIALEPVIKDV